MAERSNAAPLWRLLLARDPRGRRRHLSEEALQVGMYLTWWQSRRLQMSAVDRHLQGLEASVRDYLAIRQHDSPHVTHEGRRARVDHKGRPAAAAKRRENNVAEPLNRLSNALATRLTWSKFAAADLDEAQRAENWRLQRFILDRIASGFLPSALPLPDLLSIDATGIRSFGELPHGDVDAGYVYQTPTDRDPLKLIFGYYGSAVSGRNLDTNYEYPLVAFHFALTTWHDYGPYHDDVALLLLESFGAARGDGLVLVTDAYYPGKQTWASRVRRLGFLPIHDLHPTDRRSRGHRAGFQTLGPELYCPAPSLTDLGSPVRDGFDLANYSLAREEQLLYSAQILELSATELFCMCPAQGPTPTVRCEHHSASLQLSRAVAPTVLDPPLKDRKPCCRGPVRIELDVNRVFAKGFQHLPSGSREWREFWTPGRTGGEGVWGNLFGENGEHAVVGVTNWVEQARTAWVYATILGIENIKALRTWWFKSHVQERLPRPVREQLAADPLLWSMRDLESLYRERFGNA